MAVCSVSSIWNWNGTSPERLPLRGTETMTILKNSKALYINGEWMSTDQLEAVINPATEAVLGEAPVGTAVHVEAAPSAAYEAVHQGAWPRLPQRARQGKLN